MIDGMSAGILYHHDRPRLRLCCITTYGDRLFANYEALEAGLPASVDTSDEAGWLLQLDGGDRLAVATAPVLVSDCEIALVLAEEPT